MNLCIDENEEDYNNVEAKNNAEIKLDDYEENVISDSVSVEHLEIGLVTNSIMHIENHVDVTERDD